MKTISIAEARELGLTHYFTGKMCRRGHTSSRLTSTGNCDECAKLRNATKGKEYYEYNKKDILARQRKRYDKDPEKHLKSIMDNYWKNRDSVLEQQREYYKENSEEILAKSKERYYNNGGREYSREWHKQNPHVNANRRNKKEKATPKWFDHNNVKEIYDECKRLTEETGIAHHVDHIVPLQGKNVCGLHWSHNLQVITAEENLKKSNTFTEDLLPTSRES